MDLDVEIAGRPAVGKDPIVSEIINLCSPAVKEKTRHAANGATEASVIIDLCSPDVKKNAKCAVSSITSVPSAASALNTSNTIGLKCPICLYPCAERQPYTTKCGHVFCKECITHIVRQDNKCPICKAKLRAKDFFRIYL